MTDASCGFEFLSKLLLSTIPPEVVALVPCYGPAKIVHKLYSLSGDSDKRYVLKFFLRSNANAREWSNRFLYMNSKTDAIHSLR